MEFDHTLQIVVVGQAQVGKTSIINVITENLNAEVSSTEYPEFERMKYESTGHPVSVLLWDVPNSVKHPEFFTDSLGRQEAILKFANACIVVYDSTNLDTLKDQYETCKKFNWLPDKSLLPILFIGNKNDLPGAKDWKEKILKMSGGYKNCIFVNKASINDIQRAFNDLVEKSIESTAIALSKYLIGGIDE